MPYEFDREILAVFGSGLLLNVGLSVAFGRQRRPHASLWAFCIGFAVAIIVAWSLSWAGAAPDASTAIIKTSLLLFFVGLPLALATLIMRLLAAAPLPVRAGLALFVGVAVAPLMPVIGLFLVCGLTSDCP